MQYKRIKHPNLCSKHTSNRSNRASACFATVLLPLDRHKHRSSRIINQLFNSATLHCRWCSRSLSSSVKPTAFASGVFCHACVVPLCCLKQTLDHVYRIRVYSAQYTICGTQRSHCIHFYFVLEWFSKTEIIMSCFSNFSLDT